MDWSPSHSPVSTLTHYIHNNKSETIFLAYPNLLGVMDKKFHGRIWPLSGVMG